MSDGSEALGTYALRVKLTKPIDRMGRIRTVYLLCTRVTLGTTALRVMVFCYDKKKKTCMNQTLGRLRTRLIFYENLC